MYWITENDIRSVFSEKVSLRVHGCSLCYFMQILNSQAITSSAVCLFEQIGKRGNTSPMVKQVQRPKDVVRLRRAMPSTNSRLKDLQQGSGVREQAQNSEEQDKTNTGVGGRRRVGACRCSFEQVYRLCCTLADFFSAGTPYTKEPINRLAKGKRLGKAVEQGYRQKELVTATYLAGMIGSIYSFS